MADGPVLSMGFGNDEFKVAMTIYRDVTHFQENTDACSCAAAILGVTY